MRSEECDTVLLSTVDCCVMFLFFEFHGCALR